MPQQVGNIITVRPLHISRDMVDGKFKNLCFDVFKYVEQKFHEFCGRAEATFF